MDEWCTIVIINAMSILVIYRAQVGGVRLGNEVRVEAANDEAAHDPVIISRGIPVATRRVTRDPLVFPCSQWLPVPPLVLHVIHALSYHSMQTTLQVKQMLNRLRVSVENPKQFASV